MKQFVETLLKTLVDFPEKVEVNEVSAGKVLVFEVCVSQDDMGRVVGKGGHNITSIRTLSEHVGARSGKRVIIELIEPKR